jgi:hypothetical protein
MYLKDPRTFIDWIANLAQDQDKLKKHTDGSPNFPLHAQEECLKIVRHLQSLKYQDIPNYSLIDKAFERTVQNHDQHDVSSVSYSYGGFDWIGGADMTKGLSPNLGHTGGSGVGLGSKNGVDERTDPVQLQKILCARCRTLGKDIQKARRLIAANLLMTKKTKKLTVGNNPEIKDESRTNAITTNPFLKANPSITANTLLSTNSLATADTLTDNNLVTANPNPNPNPNPYNLEAAKLILPADLLIGNILPVNPSLTANNLLAANPLTANPLLLAESLLLANSLPESSVKDLSEGDYAMLESLLDPTPSLTNESAGIDKVTREMEVDGDDDKNNPNTNSNPNSNSLPKPDLENKEMDMDDMTIDDIVGLMNATANDNSVTTVTDTDDFFNGLKNSLDPINPSISLVPTTSISVVADTDDFFDGLKTSLNPNNSVDASINPTNFVTTTTIVKETKLSLSKELALNDYSEGNTAGMIYHLLSCVQHDKI